MKIFSGQVLVRERRARDWSIPDLVYEVRRLTGVTISEATVRDHEQGRALNPRAQTIAAYAAALGMEPGAFFTKRGRKLQKPSPVPNN